MAEKKLICVICPVGCEILATIENGKLKKIKGYRCEQGKDYAKEEFTSPSRILTATVSVKSRQVGQLPVRSTKPLPRQKLEKAMFSLVSINLKPPIKEGQLILEDILNTGVDIVATRDLEK